MYSIVYITVYIIPYIPHTRISGPTIPIYKRDQSMPAWWTIYHDYSLLQGVLTYGYKEYKTIFEYTHTMMIEDVPVVGDNSSDNSGDKESIPTSCTIRIHLNKPYDTFTMPVKETGR